MQADGDMQRVQCNINRWLYGRDLQDEAQGRLHHLASRQLVRFVPG